MIEITKEMKDWFGQGEWDVDLMLRLGILKESYLRGCLNVLIDSPWFGKMYE